MNRYTSKHNIDGAAELLTFVIFAGCILSVLLAGTGIYKRLAARDNSAYERRSCAQYVAMKLRQAECADRVSLQPFGEGEALCIRENIGGREYATYIYCYNGWLRELFASAEENFAPEAGEKLLETTAMEASVEGKLLTVRFTASDGAETGFSLALRGGEGTA